MTNELAPLKFSNPAPLGLAGFALTTWLLSMINAGWFSADGMNLVLAVALAYGGTAQIIAGVMELPRGNTFGATAFVSYGAFWWSFALFVLFLHDKVPAAFVGWYLFLWGVFTFYMWLASLRARAATYLPCAVDHFLPAGGGGMDRHGHTACRWGLRRPDHRDTGVLSVGRRGDQRKPSAHGVTDRRTGSPQVVA